MENEGTVKFIYKSNSEYENVELEMLLEGESCVKMEDLANHFYNFCCGISFTPEEVKRYIRAYDEEYKFKE